MLLTLPTVRAKAPKVMVAALGMVSIFATAPPMVAFAVPGISNVTKFGLAAMGQVNDWWNSHDFTVDVASIGNSTAGTTDPSYQFQSNLGQYLTDADMKKLQESGALMSYDTKKSYTQAGYAGYEQEVKKFQQQDPTDIAFLKNVTTAYYVNPSVYGAITSGKIKDMSVSQIQSLANSSTGASTTQPQGYAGYELSSNPGQAMYIGTSNQTSFGGFEPPPDWLQNNEGIQVFAPDLKSSLEGAAGGATATLATANPALMIGGTAAGAVIGNPSDWKMGFNPLNNLDRTYAQKNSDGSVTIDFLGFAALWGSTNTPAGMTCSSKPILKVGVGWFSFNWGKQVTCTPGTNTVPTLPADGVCPTCNGQSGQSGITHLDNTSASQHH